MELKNKIFYMNFISNFLTNNVYNCYPTQIFSNRNQNINIEKQPNKIHRENFIPKNNLINQFNYPLKNNNSYTVYNNLNINNNVNNYFIIQNNFPSQINSNNYIFNQKKKEETEKPIFQVKLKLISNEEYKTFKIYRNDNLLYEFHNFCIENKIPIVLFKPLIIQIISSMNKFHYLFNKDINSKNLEQLISIWKNYNKKV